MTTIPEFFGSNVFSRAVMKERLPKKVYAEVVNAMENGGQISMATADVVADAMKNWAVEKGATHYCHWFQPLTGMTAEKHDAFISPNGDGTVIMDFSGKELIKGEPDGSSFPSGGIRSTFEARGYTNWDPTSYAFIKEKTLCIPTAFCSYAGEALDEKTPLLRSMDAINKQGLRIAKLMGMNDVEKIITSVGPEQEYFLVDRDVYEARPDLVYCGRTLFGSKPPKRQELNDHYFGAIKPRIKEFMEDLNNELWKVGILSKTEHNEVAPAQHEMAPIYTETNVALDHNQLTMEILKKVAERHDMACLLHEKPFAGVNGSGKHTNWSISTDTGVNLLSPGKKPEENTIFLLTLAAVIQAVDDYQDLLRVSVASAGNDHRLGGHEAPPAIISIFLGEELADVVESIISGSKLKKHDESRMEFGATMLPTFMRDNTDRNRTSPFAFTGNRFEFRMTGSEMSIGDACYVLNTIVAESFAQFADRLEAADDLDAEIKELLKEVLTKHKRIIFNGDGYADEWLAEAERRGLPNIKSMVYAIPALTTDTAIKLFGDFKVFTEAELVSRAEVKFENYAKTINIEAKTMIDMASKQIIPAVIKYATSLAGSINTITAAGVTAVGVQKNLLNETSALLEETQKALDELIAIENAGCEMEDGEAKAKYYYEKVTPAMEALRAPVDKLEMIVDKEMWPMPSYGDLMFEV